MSREWIIPKAIITLKSEDVEIIPRWQAPGNLNSVEFWDYVSENPVGDHYKFVHCKEHDCQEAVPDYSYDQGLLYLWYSAGLHPRFNIWKALRDGYPGFRRSWLGSWAFSATDLDVLLQEHKDDPDGFVKAFRKARSPQEMVSLTAGGRTWKVTRAFRERFHKADFKVKEFIRNNNQTERRLMLLSRAFTVQEVVGSFMELAKDKEGVIYDDRQGQHYLHVVCPTTSEQYLLGIPQRWKCQDCGFKITTGEQWPQRWHNCTGPRRNWPIWELAWTPAEARRWTFELDSDATLVAEA